MNIEVGQQFRQVTPPRDTWEVIQILENAGPIPHARVMRVNGVKDVKTISVPALSDNRLYEAIGEDE